MLQFLKESTFRANEVFYRAITILGKNYISIAGLCFLLFLVSNLSTFLSLYLQEHGGMVKVLMLLLFVFLYFSLQLVLLKRALHIVRHDPPIGFVNYIPSFKQFSYYLLGLVIYSLLAGLVYLVLYVVCFGFVWLGVSIDTVQTEIHPFLTGLTMMLIVLRTIFYPFFIIDHQSATFKAYKFSVAMTKGNVFRLLFIVFFVALIHILQLFSEYMGYIVLSKICSVLNSFVVIPLVSIVMSIVYVDMMKNYHGGDDPDLLDNII